MADAQDFKRKATVKVEGASNPDEIQTLSQYLEVLADICEASGFELVSITVQRRK